MGVHSLGPDEGRRVDLGGIGVRFMLDAGRTGGGFSLVEHPIGPRKLGSPVHTHSREDEWSYILEGRVGFELGGDVLEAGPGELVYKPRDEPHAFWNATDEPARFLETISPSGFEQYFADAAELIERPGERDVDAFMALIARYGLTMDFASVPRLVEEHGLEMPPQPDRS